MAARKTGKTATHPLDYSKARIRREVLVRQRRGMWTPEQVESLARHFRLKPGMRLLDAGCGYGYALRTWGRFCLPGGELVGLDREKRLLAGAKRYCRKEGLARAARFVRGDVCAMPFPDGEFDVTLASVVLCHLAEPEKALDEMIRVTRPGGCIVVFDNAISGSPAGGWASWYEPTVKERMLAYEVGLRALVGRKKLGFGDHAVGCYVPGWMEARGLLDVGVRTNERVTWIAPPYRSPEQQVAYRNTKERQKEKGRSRLERRGREQMLAGGCTEKQIRDMRDRGRKMARRLKRAVGAGKAAFAWSGPFWCIWGFKPQAKIDTDISPPRPPRSPIESERTRSTVTRRATLHVVRQNPTTGV